MANTLLTPSVIAKAALGTLYSTCVMAQLVHRDYESEFVPKVGTTVTIRKPTTFTAQEFTSTIDVQNATETSVPIVLNHHRDVSFQVTTADLTLKVIDFAAQFMNPAMEAMAQVIDQDVLTLRNDVVQEVGTKGATTSGVDGTNEWDWDNPRVTIDADRVLNARKVPPSQRSVVVGPTTKARWLGDDLMSKANERGDTDGLRDASLGNKVYGFTPYMTQNITGTDEQSIAFHKTAFALVMRPLELPPGASEAATATYKGFSVRVVKDYNILTKVSVISIDALYGVKCLAPERACLIWQNAS
jgi:hypothetical protein